MTFPELIGERIKLVELAEDGLGDLFEYSKNYLLYKYFELKPIKTIGETKAYLQKLLHRNESENAHYWFIHLISSNKIIGSFGVHDIDWRKKDAEISYGLSPEYWSKGYFCETLKIVLQYLFNILDFHRVCAITRSDNAPSIKGLEKVGFQKEGVLREYYLSHDAKRYDATIMAIINIDFQTKNNALSI